VLIESLARQVGAAEPSSLAEALPPLQGVWADIVE
jgi:hypothetical protein